MPPADDLGLAEPAAVAFRGVSRSFQRQGTPLQALDSIDLVIEPGEFVSVIGPSGCGKSTLLRLAGGLLAPDQGEITVAASSPREARRRKRFGFVPQEPALLPWKTVGENAGVLVELNPQSDAPGLDPEAQIKLLERIGLGPFIDAYPRELSGGLQQRVAIARAFALAAPVLLMDEPFSSLDEITRTGMRYLLLDLWEQQRSTVLFVTHSIPEAVTLADRVVVLSARPGRISDIVEVPLPRPRDEELEESPVFLEVVGQVRAALRKGWTSP